MIGIAGATLSASRYQLKISLHGSKPVIWRRVVVPSTILLDRLHMVIQTVMGWTNSHRHQFCAYGIIYGEPNPDLGLKMLNEGNHTLRDIAAGKTFFYEYNAGDGWVHEVVVEKLIPNKPLLKHPVCLDGANACPSENCGGIAGHWKVVAAINDPSHENYEEIKEWVADSSKATFFDLERTNSLLGQIKP